MLLSRYTCLRSAAGALRSLSTATAYQVHTIPSHASPARESAPKIPNLHDPPPASTATPASATAIGESPPTLTSSPVPVNPTASPVTNAPSLRKARRPRKQVLTLTQDAVYRLREIQSDEGKLIKISVVAKGCAGGAYKLEYVDKVERFDEIVEQDGVRVLVDSKSLMKIIGSEMDFTDDVLASRFTFRNPNVVSTCGCEESFATKEDEERLLSGA